MNNTPNIVALGAGRMGRGIAQMFAYAGHDVTILDFKKRDPKDSRVLLDGAISEIEENLKFLSSLEILKIDKIKSITNRIQTASSESAENILSCANFIFEGVPEIQSLKQDVIKEVTKLASKTSILASTTSTMLSTQLATSSKYPENFLNAHFLNPAYLIPLVEISPSEQTSQNVMESFIELIESIGKIPVLCKASPGYIIPRFQSLIMNEAARMIEEGIASPEDIDKAVRVGFGIRYATMGPLEFIDWGGLDILKYASSYLSENLDKRFEAPEIIEKKMQDGNLGMNTGKGFYDFSKLDIDKYKTDKLSTFIGLLKKMNLMPKQY
tara:strand:+ start:195 stop:1172 length:978 start_codon:yes stop_codon:yes gene_type:complete